MLLSLISFFVFSSFYILTVGAEFILTLDHTHTTPGRTPLDEGSARRRDFYLTTHNTHNRKTFMPPAGFEPAILARKQPQTHALDRAATGIDLLSLPQVQIFSNTYPDSSTYVLPFGSVTKFHTHTKTRMNLSVLAIG